MVLDNLTKEQSEAIRKFLVPIGHREGDELHRGIGTGGKFIEDKESEFNDKVDKERCTGSCDNPSKPL